MPHIYKCLPTNIKYDITTIDIVSKIWIGFSSGCHGEPYCNEEPHGHKWSYTLSDNEENDWLILTLPLVCYTSSGKSRRDLSSSNKKTLLKPKLLLENKWRWQNVISGNLEPFYYSPWSITLDPRQCVKSHMCNSIECERSQRTDTLYLPV